MNFLFDMKFQCSGFRRHFQFFLMIELSQITGYQYDKLAVPFTKLCRKGVVRSWIHELWGSTDDVGHLVLAMSLGAYSLWCVIFSVFPFQEVCVSLRPVGLLGSRSPDLPGDEKPANGMLEIMVLLTAGFIGTIGHLTASQAKLFHILGHLIMLAVGLLSFVLRSIPIITDATFPFCLIVMALLYALHDQTGSQAADVQFIFSILLALCGATRLAALYEERLAFVAGWLGLWAAITFILASEGSISAQLELGVGPTEVAVFSGVLSSAFCTCVVLSSRGTESDVSLDENDDDDDSDTNEHTTMIGKGSSP